jgi:hypothetical protein
MAQPVPAQVPIAAPVASVPSSGALNFNSTPDMVVPRARRPLAKGGKRRVPRIALVAAGLVAVVGMAWGVRWLIRMNDKGGGDPSRDVEVYNSRFAWPGKPWTRQTNIQQKLHVHIGMISPEHNDFLALFFKDYKTRMPSDAEMLDEALSKLRSYFHRLEWEMKPKDEQARLAGQPAKAFDFQGDDAENVPMNGECYMLALRGYGYWFFTWAPLDDLQKDGEPIRAEWAQMRQHLSLLDGRKGWMAKPPETQTVTGTKVKYQLAYVKGLWTRETAEDYDPLPDVVLKGHEPDPERKPLAGKDASFQVFVLPKQDNLKSAAAAARAYVLQREKKLYEQTKMEPIKDKNGDVDRPSDIGKERGQLSKLDMKNTDDLERFLTIAVVNRPEGVVVLVGDCLWERRDFWDQEFAALLGTFQIKGR